MKVRFPVDQQRQFYIYIFADNKYGAWVVSELVTVNVIFKPKSNPYFGNLDLYLKNLMIMMDNKTDNSTVPEQVREVLVSKPIDLTDLPPNLKFLESLLSRTPAPIKQAFKKRLSQQMGFPVDITKYNCFIFDFSKLGILSILFETEMHDEKSGVKLQ